MRVGDLVKYKTRTPDFRIGLILKILSKFERDDNILVMWHGDHGQRAWCVREDWIEKV